MLHGAPAERLTLTVFDQAVLIAAEVAPVLAIGLRMLAIGARSFKHRD